MALRRDVPRGRLLGGSGGGHGAAAGGARAARGRRPLLGGRGGLAGLLGGGGGAARPVALAVPRVLRRDQCDARRRGGHDLPVLLGRPGLRAGARLDPGLPEEARLRVADAHLRPRNACRSGCHGGRALRRHLLLPRPADRGAHRDARASERPRAGAQRAADRQRAPLPPAGRRPSRRARGARARAGEEPRPADVGGLGGPGDARAPRGPERGGRRARADPDRQGLPLQLRLHGRRPRDGEGAMTTAVEEHRVDVEGVAVSTDHFIGGERVSSPERFEDVSPIDEQVIAHIARGGGREADLPLPAPDAACPAWAALGPAGRAPIMHRLADLIDEHVEQLAAVECRDMAMLLRSLRARGIHRGARNFRAYADLAMAYEERDWRSNGTWNRIQRMPAGPAVVITPWNAPFMLSTWKVAPALAAGCTVVLKPAEWSPLSCSYLADVATEAGFPPGVLNVIQGIGEEVGAAAVAHPLARRVALTGSVNAARHIGQATARNVVPFTAELGGKNPFIVFADADLEAAARKAAGQYDDAGQVCLSGTRILVEASVADEFLERFDRAADEHVLGDPRDDATTVTPLIHRDHFANVDGFVQRAREHGDEILRGGGPSELGGLFYAPTLIRPRSNESEVVQHEIFGPVLCLQTFAAEAEAIALANSTEYGLAAIIYTSSMGRADRVGRAVRAGVAWVNTFLVRDLTAPFGGMGVSGIGREGGEYALDFYSDLKTLQILEGTVG